MNESCKLLIFSFNFFWFGFVFLVLFSKNLLAMFKNGENCDVYMSFLPNDNMFLMYFM